MIAKKWQGKRAKVQQGSNQLHLRQRVSARVVDLGADTTPKLVWVGQHPRQPILVYPSQRR